MEKIIDKVKKLIALGTNEGATEGERENAMRMAHALIAKHNIDNDMLADYSEKREILTSKYHNVPWTGIVANAMAKLFFCYCYCTKASDSRMEYKFVGKASNALTAQLMADYLVKAITKEQKKLGATRSFNNAAASKIYMRVKEMMEVENLELSTGTGLAVINKYKSEEQANKDFIAGTCIVLIDKKRSTQNASAADYAKGINYGANVSLNNQVGSSKQNTKKLN